MTEMGELTDRYVRSALTEVADVSATVIWVGGSLGRREMLPNSDLDLFIISATPSNLRVPIGPIPGLDRVEIGHVSLTQLRTLATHTLIDLNQFIDGRPLTRGETAERVAAVLATANTYDRQYANLIAEHFYYRHFDFLNKRTTHGPNMKYSSGSSRTTLFFNFFNRIASGEMPWARGAGPEYLEGMAQAQAILDVPATYRAVELVQVVKNAAILTFDQTTDIRQRYLSRRSLERIYDICRPRLRSYGIEGRDDLPETYASARHELESSVSAVVERTVSLHRSVEALRDLAAARVPEVPGMCADLVDRCPEDAATLTTFSAWSIAVRPETTTEDLDRMTFVLLERPPHQVGGAIMAVACHPASSDIALRRLLDWTAADGTGSYISKLVSRNPNATTELRHRARQQYEQTEFVRVQ